MANKSTSHTVLLIVEKCREIRDWIRDAATPKLGGVVPQIELRVQANGICLIQSKIQGAVRI